MIEHHLDRQNAILHVRPHGPLAKADFEALAKVVDPFIDEVGDLAGLIVEVPAFPGWASFGGMIAHLKFVRGHHRHIRKVAAVTDSPLGDIAQRFACHFVAAEIRHFPASGLDAATAWISEVA